MKDFLGQELRIGDNVIHTRTTYGASKQLEQSKVTGFTKTQVILDSGRKNPDKIVNIGLILNNIK